MESSAGPEGTGFSWCLDMEKLWPQLEQPNIYFSFPKSGEPHDLRTQGSWERGETPVPSAAALFKHSVGTDATELRIFMRKPT